MTEPGEEQGATQENGFHWAWCFVLTAILTWQDFLWVGRYFRRYGEETMFMVFGVGFAVILALTVFVILYHRRRQRHRQAPNDTEGAAGAP